MTPVMVLKTTAVMVLKTTPVWPWNVSGALVVPVHVCGLTRNVHSHGVVMGLMVRLLDEFKVCASIDLSLFFLNFLFRRKSLKSCCDKF